MGITTVAAVHGAFSRADKIGPVYLRHVKLCSDALLIATIKLDDLRELFEAAPQSDDVIDAAHLEVLAALQAATNAILDFRVARNCDGEA